MTNYHVNRKYKDSLFRMIFKDKKELLSLYNAINESNYTDPELLEVRTLEDVIYMGVKNDVSFLINDYLSLYEAQSTWNPNMPLRGLLYFAKLYEGYIADYQLDVYSYKQLKIPNPKFIVFYNGMTYKEDVLHLSLSDSFLHPQQSGDALECTATVLNINYGHNKKIMDSCRKLYEYSYLIEEVRKWISQKISLETAIDQAIDTCIQNDILESFLRRHRAEVRMSILEFYDEELHMKTLKELGFEEGHAEGLSQGRREGIFNILQKFSSIPEDIIEKINDQKDPDILLKWMTLAATADSMEEFQNALEQQK